ncbi:CocE/NonD family hydrolase [Micromonospora sp. KC721]|uniref:CocE/NonD family hydrolase n=1 Tax=Micromonospora sp. KC721 TaxID=2530380 RepID=UPI00104F4CD5|nr:CocE/NonD family hydrolase [Micromonospora sp. KC721]TDB73105.1 CocE/NonD family hydrolase [Micromonospora sp. KC721]
MTIRVGIDVSGLATDVWLPDGPATTVLVRTPYGTPGLWPEAAAYAAAGYAVVLQDVRGRFRSAGRFTAGADETADGHAAVDWVTSQPWSDGRVVLVGTGYETYTAWCASGHPAVAGVVSRQPWPAGDGFPPVDAELWWRTEHGTGRVGHPGLTPLAAAVTDLPLDDGELPDRWPVDIRPWPPSAADTATAQRRVEEAVAQCRAPSLHLGSWYCRSAAATLRHAALATEATCVVGGWVSPLTHELSAECAIDVPVDPDPSALALEWLVGTLDGPRTLWLGSGAWRAGSPMPPAPARTRELIASTGPVVLTADPGRAYPSLPHSADLGPLTDVPGVLAATADGPLAYHGPVTCRVSGRADAPSQLVATLVHETPAGVRTVLTDGVTQIPDGPWTVEIACRPVAVDLPCGHRLRLELTTGRYPRHPRPPAPATLTITTYALDAPEPEESQPCTR